MSQTSDNNMDGSKRMERSRSLSPFLDDNTDATVTALRAGIQWNQIDNSFKANKDEYSIGLQSSSVASDFEDMTVSKFLQNSLCATPNKTEVNRKGFVSRTNQATTLKRDTLASNRAFQSALDSSHEANVSDLSGPSKISTFCTRARNSKKSSGNPDLFQNMLNSSTDTSHVQFSPRKKTRLQAKKVSKSDFENAFDSSALSDADLNVSKTLRNLTTSDKTNAKKGGFIWRAMQNCVPKNRSGKLDGSFNKSSEIDDSLVVNTNKRKQSIKTMKNNFQMAFDSSVETSVTDVVENEKHSAFSAKAIISRKKSSNYNAFQDVFNLSANNSDVQPSPRKGSRTGSPDVSQSDATGKRRASQRMSNGGNPEEVQDASDVAAKSISISNERNLSNFEGDIASPDSNEKESEQPPNGNSAENLVQSENKSNLLNNSVEVKDKSVLTPNEIIVNVSNVNEQLPENNVADTLQTDISHRDLLKVNSEIEELSNISDKTAGLHSEAEDDVTRDKSNRYSLKSVIVEDREQVSGHSLVAPLRQSLCVSDVSKLINSGRSLSQPSAILHIESDYDSMESSSESGDENDDKEQNGNESKSLVVNYSEDKYDSTRSSNITPRRSSRVALSELDCNSSSNNDRSLSKKQNRSNLSVNETLGPKEKVLSTTMANRIKLMSENYDSMEITNDSVAVEKSTVTSESVNVLINKSERAMSLRKRSNSAETNKTTLSDKNKSVCNDRSCNVENDMSVDETSGGSDRSWNVENNMSVAETSGKKSTSVVADATPRRSSLRKRNSNSSQGKSTQVGLVSFNLTGGSDKSDSMCDLSSASDSENKSLSSRRQKPKSTYKRPKRSRNETPKFNCNPNRSNDIPLSELKSNYKRTNNKVLANREAIDDLLSFPKAAIELNKHNVVLENENESFVQNKVPKLFRPKKWVTKSLYDSLIPKLQSRYGVRSHRRAEKFVEYLCNKFYVVTHLNTKEELKTEVNGLVIEMAKLQLIVNYWDFYDFVQTFMPRSFCVKSVPMTCAFNELPLVDPPNDAFASIL